MPYRMTERHARRLIRTLRGYTPDENPWTIHPDGALMSPILVREAHAAADAIEYFLDTYGVEGLDHYRGIQHIRESMIPRGFDDPPCDCPVHDQACPPDHYPSFADLSESMADPRPVTPGREPDA